MSNSDKLNLHDSIAVTGMSGRFPGAKNITEFWQNLKNGEESITFFSDEELRIAGVEADLLNDPNYVKAGALLEDVDKFDAAFFGYTPKEAAIMDPQHRLFLECAWEAIEHSGTWPENFPGRIGVYAGVSMNSYLLFNLLGSSVIESARGLQTVIGNNHDFLTTRVSYKLNLKGPSLDVQSSCSTSLVAVHLACQSLLNGECDAALAGGVSIVLPQKTGYLYQEQGIYSPDGHCRAFDERAQGTAGGRGVGVVVLKRFEDAQADGDPVYAVIRGSAINNDGWDKVGYTAPSVDGQAEVIAEALAVADVEPETISYIEAHGTGTPLGDPIEIEALAQAFRTGTNKRGFCAIGSVKTNIGHLDAAAGVTGLIKTVLALHNEQLPASLNFEKPNPKIDFANTPFYVNAGLTDWKAGATPRRAGVSSFGMGGTNAHVVLEEAPKPATSEKSRLYQLLLLSARSEVALEATTSNLADYLRNHPECNLADVAFTLQVGRKPFGYRRMLVTSDTNEALKTLEKPGSHGILTRAQNEKQPQVIFMFPGQGAQYIKMGFDLYQAEPVFRQHIDQCSEILNPDLNLDLRHSLYPKESDLAAAAENLKQTNITQPALFAVEYALAQLWISWGVKPQAMIGHSIGEYVSACLSGVLLLEDALKLVALRGRLMQKLPAGSMLAIPRPVEEVKPLLDDSLSIAAINHPAACVVSGATAAVDKLEAQFAKNGCRRLHTSHAFHSSMMEPILDEFTAEVAGIKLNPPETPYISNVTGDWISAEETTNPQYWARHLRQTVRFAEGISMLLQKPGCLLLEVGPGRTLSSLVERQKSTTNGVETFPSLRHPRERQSDNEYLLKSLGRLWLAGVTVDWSGFYANEKRSRISLPTYPFQRQSYWVEQQKGVSVSLEKNLPSGKNPDIADWFYLPSWKRSNPPQRISDRSKDDKSPWLIFSDSLGLGDKLKQKLGQLGQQVIVVKIGERFEKCSDNTYTINPRNAEDYRALVAAVGSIKSEIIHLWGIEPAEKKLAENLQEEMALDLGFYSLLFLAQAIGSQDVTASAGITIFTSGVQEVTGDEILFPEKATVLGVAKVIPQEYPHINCRSIDLVVPESGDWNERPVNEFLAEVGSRFSEPVVAYRNGFRWVQTYEPCRLEEKSGQPTGLREGGIYLITGGIGGIGLEIAQYLAKSFKAKLVLTGRSELPVKTEWQTYVKKHTPKDELSRKIQKVLELEASGAEVVYFAADVSDELQMFAVLEQTEKRFGAIHGVFHAAGAEKSAPIIQEITRAECEQQFRPKLPGVKVLEKILHGKDLDFCMLLSSLSSVLGALGFVAYTAAHLYLDTFIQKHNRTGPVRWTGVNWDNWLNWKETESALSGSEADFYMTPDEGTAAFARIFENGSIPQLVVSTGNLQSRIKRWLKPELAEKTAQKEAATFSIQHQRPDLGNDYVAPGNETEETLAAIWAEALGLKSVGVDDNYFELGGDSVLSIQIIARASQAGLRLKANQIFEHQTIAELAQVAEGVDKFAAKQDPVSGALPLTPIQHWFFEQDFEEPYYFNLPMLLEVKAGLDSALVAQAVEHVFTFHEMLRLRFRQEKSKVEQFYTDSKVVFKCKKIDLTKVSEADQNGIIFSASSEQQAGFDLLKGPLAGAVYFDFGIKKPGRLLLVVHHLVIDVVSWRILLEDLQAAVQQLVAGQTPQLPPRTTSYKEWSEKLSGYAITVQLESQRDYWLSLPWAHVESLPKDRIEGPNLLGSMKIVTSSLDQKATRALLTDVPPAYNTRINEVLLTALLLAFQRWIGASTLLLNLEGHGREEELVDSVNLSRTVGWFTSLFPVLLSAEDKLSPGDLLKSIKEQIRRIPNKGVGYGVLRYLKNDKVLADKLRLLPQPEISFLYMGRFKQDSSPDSFFKTMEGETGPAASPKTRRGHLFDISCLIRDDRLQIEWMYGEQIHERATVEKLADTFLRELNGLIDHCKSTGQTNYSPADFPGANLSQKDLDILLGVTGQS